MKDDHSNHSQRPTDSISEAVPAFREIKFRHSEHFVPLLRSLRRSLLISTYAAGKLAVVGTNGDGPAFSFLNFEQCMGIAVREIQIALGTRHQIWFLHEANNLSAQSPATGTYDACYLPRTSFHTAHIHGLELAWGSEGLWVLNSGCGELGMADQATGEHETVESMPGYTRGLAFAGPFAFVGLSQIRETAVFGGVPITERRDELRCGAAVVDLRSGKSMAYLEFLSSVNEAIAVEVLLGVVNPCLREPIPADEETPDIWVVPPEGIVPK